MDRNEMSNEELARILTVIMYTALVANGRSMDVKVIAGLQRLMCIRLGVDPKTAHKAAIKTLLSPSKD